MRALCLLCMWLALCVSQQALAVKLGDAIVLPAVTLLDGTRLEGTNFVGKPTLVVVWASWCPYCAKHNPSVQKLIDQTKGSDLQVLTVTVDQDLNAARQYLIDKDYTFAATADARALERVLGTKRALPRTYLIDRSGKLAFVEYGEMFEEDVLALRRFVSREAQQ